MIFPLMFPKLPNDIAEPPTIYSLLESIVNFDNENKSKIKDLAKNGRSVIFDFDYPLTNYITKENFECMILNKFLMRRIGFDTLTAFKIQLNVKLNEIMPRYNKLFNSLEGWNLFSDGEIETRLNTETNSSTSSLTGTSSGTETASSTEDLRYSNTPQNRLSDVQNGNYVTDYNYNTNSASNSTSSTSSQNGSTTGTNNIQESITRTPSNKIDIYMKFIENKNNIYTMIFNDLECLFYSLV